MKIYFSDIRSLDASLARRRGRSPSAGSAFAYSLLEHAARELWGIYPLPEIVTENGRPRFAGYEDKHFSLSHCRTHVLAALSEYPVGADIEAERPVSESLLMRATDARERAEFDFLELWTLRESVYKLSGRGDLRSMRIRRAGERIVPEDEPALCAAYFPEAGLYAAAASYRDAPPPELIFVPPALLTRQERA